MQSRLACIYRSTCAGYVCTVLYCTLLVLCRVSARISFLIGQTTSKQRSSRSDKIRERFVCQPARTGFRIKLAPKKEVPPPSPQRYFEDLPYMGPFGSYILILAGRSLRCFIPFHSVAN